ncbi:MAG: beta-ketoacyl synthase N-terminal-like domain-containing protein [Phycisphaerales bacterium]|nr:hypothetical protein [Phycisphaerales bacterium]
MSRRVVITGLGVVSPMGVGIDALWEGLCAGRCAIGPMTRIDASGFACKHAAEAKEFSSARDYVPKNYRKAVKVMARDTEIAVAAAKLATEDAGIVTKGYAEEHAALTYEPGRLGCQIGAGLINAEVPELSAALSTATDGAGAFSLAKWGESAVNNLTPLWMLKYLPNMLACHVTIIHDARGPSNTLTCSEASGLLSIGESMRVIEQGRADACFAGGAESKLNHMGVLRMQLSGRVAPTESGEDGASIVRPFDRDARGLVIGEGGGIVMLESEETATARGARAYARVLGFGAGQSPSRGDASRRAEGMVVAIRSALRDGDIEAAEIDVIVPHGAGVLRDDEAELAALREVFGDRLASIPLMLMSPMVGELSAGAGGVAVAAAAMALRHQMLPARVHGGSPDARVLAGRAEKRPATLRRILVVTNSLGGQNAALVLSSE